MSNFGYSITPLSSPVLSFSIQMTVKAKINKRKKSRIPIRVTLVSSEAKLSLIRRKRQFCELITLN